MIGKRVIADLKDIEGEVDAGRLVTYFGEPYWVINPSYSDDKGPGVELELVYNETVRNFLWEKTVRLHPKYTQRK